MKGAGDLIPNQGVLINAIVLQETKLSSEVENAVPGWRVITGRAYVRETNLLGEHVEKIPVFEHIPGIRPRRGYGFEASGISLWRDTGIAPPKRFYLARFQYRDTCGQVRNFDYGSYPLGVFFAGFAPSCGSRRGLLGIAAQ